ncbi:MAG TPA: hypothetical protein VFI65_25365 [Streptosporangiaceae bacterium]|nr:hypothetical protein [Streptosporangiaceae bacterium]
MTATSSAKHASPTTRTSTGKPASTIRRLIRWRNTPERIRGLTASIIVVTIAFGIIVAAIFASVSGGVHLIGGQAAPEVKASTDLYFRLNDMDAQVANILLVGDRNGLGQTRQQSQAIFDRDRSSADHDLQDAAAVAGSSQAAQQAVRSVLDGLGRYEALVGQIIYLENAGPSKPGRPPTAALTVYRTATDLLRTGILPAASKLTTANAAALTATYQAKHSLAGRAALLTLLIGLVLIGALVGMQLFISATHRRLLNPALAGATLITIALTAAGALSFAAQAHDLHVAKQDAFDSISALSQARAVSYDANANESRYLVDPGRAGQYQQDFESESQELARVNTTSIFGYDAALATAVTAYRANHAHVGFGGFFGIEFRNITFPGERVAAQRTLYTYQIYEKYDRRLRALDRSGDLSGAIAFDTSSAPGNSNWAFYRYDQALTSLIGINQHALDNAITASEHGETGWTGPIPLGAMLAIVVLSFVGARARLAEYR